MFFTAGDSNKGRKRSHNEDCFCLARDPDRAAGEGPVLAAVADGIGGHSNGELASYICCRDLLNGWLRSVPADPDAAERMLMQNVTGTNERLFARNLREKNLRPMGTTVAAGVFFEKEFLLISAGDSRCYECTGKGIRQLTRDHVARCLCNGNEACMLTKSVGPHQEAAPELVRIPLAPGGRYLLCTDGIYRQTPDAELLRIIKAAPSPQAAVSHLIRTALLAGGQDNCTAVCVFNGSAAPEEEEPACPCSKSGM